MYGRLNTKAIEKYIEKQLDAKDVVATHHNLEGILRIKFWEYKLEMTVIDSTSLDMAITEITEFIKKVKRGEI